MTGATRQVVYTDVVEQHTRNNDFKIFRGEISGDESSAGVGHSNMHHHLQEIEHFKLFPCFPEDARRFDAARYRGGAAYNWRPPLFQCHLPERQEQIRAEMHVMYTCAAALNSAPHPNIVPFLGGLEYFQRSATRRLISLMFGAATDDFERSTTQNPVSSLQHIVRVGRITVNIVKIRSEIHAALSHLHAIGYHVGYRLDPSMINRDPKNNNWILKPEHAWKPSSHPADRLVDFSNLDILIQRLVAYNKEVFRRRAVKLDAAQAKAIAKAESGGWPLARLRGPQGRLDVRRQRDRKWLEKVKQGREQEQRQMEMERRRSDYNAGAARPPETRKVTGLLRPVTR